MLHQRCGPSQVQRPDSSHGHAPLGNFEQASAQSASEGPPSASTPGAATHSPAAAVVVVVVVVTVVVVVVVVVVVAAVVVTVVIVVPAPWQVHTDSSQGHMPAGRMLQAVAQSLSEGPYAPRPSAATHVVGAGGGAGLGFVTGSQVQTPDPSQGHMPSGTTPQT